MNNRNFYR